MLSPPDHISVASGDIFTSGSQALVNPVNTVGVMGSGLALSFKRRYPQMYEQYAADCRSRRLRPGKIMIHPLTTWGPGDPLYILNFPTKRHWRDPSQMEDIQAGLEDLKKVLEQLAVSSVSIPALGCGRGGLSWSLVLVLLLETLAPVVNCQIKLFPPR
jgi:O-acetyl-ADP-ribose deacetylase (regulator of RNase III)